MGLDILDNPIRATWDLQTADATMSTADAEIVLQKLIDAQLFFITLEQQPLAHPFCATILNKLIDHNVQLLLLSDGSAAELENLSLLAGQPVTVLIRLQPFMSVAGPDFERLEHVLTAMRKVGIDPGFSLTPLRSNVGFLHTLLEYAGKLKIPRFKLPNVRIDDNFQQSGKGDILRANDLEALRRTLPDLSSLLAGIDLEIHDLFLWELLTPGSDSTRSEYGGCQAGNSLAHIKADGTVLPCVSWPRPLGSLLESSFAEIWQSPACQSVRQSIAAKPEGCAGCRDYQLCYGGCRGLSEVLDIDEGLDPMCNGPRGL